MNKSKINIELFKSENLDQLSDSNFNNALSIFIPNCKEVPNEIINEINNYFAYSVQGVEISLLIENKFITSFINNGLIYILSQDTFIDIENSLCITPSGIFVLILNKDVYEELGLVGKPLDKKSKAQKSQKYIISIDLNNILLNEKHHLKVLNSFQRLKHKLTFNLLVSWHPNDKDICPSSIASYFEYFDLETSRVKPKSIQRMIKDEPIPILRFERQEEFLELYEWIGAISCGCEFGAIDDFTNTMLRPEPTQVFHKSTYSKFVGFFSRSCIFDIIEQIKFFLKRNTSIPFAIFTLHIFSDTPLILKDQNSICSSKTFVFFNDNNERQINFWQISAFDHNYIYK